MIHYASLGRRFWAFALSTLVDLIVLLTMRAVVGDGASVAGAFGVWYLMHHVGLVVEGGTLGHRLAGLRVVDEAGERVTVVFAFVREFAKLALSIPPLGLGILWMLDEPQRRTWHDLLAHSVVVRESDVLAQAGPSWADAPPWRNPQVASRPQDPLA
jgi:uncharacterized RDD family membrane protein YckC